MENKSREVNSKFGVQTRLKNMQMELCYFYSIYNAFSLCVYII